MPPAARRRRQIRYEPVWTPGAYETQAAPRLPRRGRPPPLYDYHYQNAGDEGDAQGQGHGRRRRRRADGLVRSWLDQFPSSSSSAGGGGGALDCGNFVETDGEDEESAQVQGDGKGERDEHGGGGDDDELWDAVLEGLVGKTAEMRLDGSGRWRLVRRGRLGFHVERRVGRHVELREETAQK